MPVGRYRYKVTEACTVGEAWAKRGDVLLLLDGDLTEAIAERWKPDAQREKFGRVLLEPIPEGDVVAPGPHQRLVPVAPTSTLTITSPRRHPFPPAD